MKKVFFYASMALLFVTVFYDSVAIEHSKQGVAYLMG